VRFSKLQATGNDFLLVDARTKTAEWAKLAQAMCDRHLGVGADGLMLVQNSTSADLKMRLFNSVGNRAGQSPSLHRDLVGSKEDRSLHVGEQG
jgi:diaminopimelate epimerase